MATVDIGGSLMNVDASRPALGYGGELWRKALHLFSLTIPAGIIMFGTVTALTVLVPLATIFVLVEILRTRYQWLREMVNKVFGFMMRPEENPIEAGPIRFNGATWVLLSAITAILLFEPMIAGVALAMGLVGDAAAALIGRKFGKHPYGGQGKTFEGSLAFVVAALPIPLLAPGIMPITAIVAVLAAAWMEGSGSPINDNLSVPIVAGGLLSLFS